MSGALASGATVNAGAQWRKRMGKDLDEILMAEKEKFMRGEMKAVKINRSGKRVPMTEWMRGIILNELIPKHGRVCWYCGVNLGNKEIHIDHVQPLSREGSDTLDNLALSCMSCNRAKWDMTLSEFFDWVKRIRWLEDFPAKPAFKHLGTFYDRGDEVDKIGK